MQTYQKIILFFGWLICLNYACDKQAQDVYTQEEVEVYELLVSYGAQADAYRRRHLVDYFQMVALGSEYGNNLPLVKKWKTPMLIHINGYRDSILLDELDHIIEELNSLFTDGFYIELSEDSLTANHQIFFGEVDRYKKTYPAVAHLIQENRGLFTIYTDKDFAITSGHMFVDNTGLALKYQKHILREELTQSLGLANDIQYYANSIFYKKWSDTQAYSDLDRETIRLLYHPKMIPKVGSTVVTSILEGILGL